MADEAPDLKQQVQDLIASNEVMLFMKGVPEAPRCGFSMRTVQVLERYGVEYGAVDALPVTLPGPPADRPWQLAWDSAWERPQDPSVVGDETVVSAHSVQVLTVRLPLVA